MIVDTLRFSKQLQDKGRFSVEQADALAETIGAVGRETLATKGDLGGIRIEIAELRSELKAEIAGAKTELLKWIIGSTGFQTLVIIGAVVTLARLGGR